MKIAVTGSNGQLGCELCRRLGANAIPLALPAFDITDRECVFEFMETERPQIVINCAAYTLVDQAENEAELCRRINTEAVRFWADACKQINSMLVQISTDYVFGGSDRRVPYTEMDSPAPLCVYGRTKRDGELAALTAERSLVVRTCGLYGHTPRKTNFVKTMLRLAADRDRLRVVNDQQCTPSYVPHVAEGIMALIDKQATGIYHLVNSGSTTWYGFALEIFRQSNIDVSVVPITTAEFAARARRPAYSVLDTSKYRALGGPPMPAWECGLAEYFAARPIGVCLEAAEKTPS
jgi:dTDP-4-dehydrorhamnose reductase